MSTIAVCPSTRPAAAITTSSGVPEQYSAPHVVPVPWPTREALLDVDTDPSYRCARERARADDRVRPSADVDLSRAWRRVDRSRAARHRDAERDAARPNRVLAPDVDTVFFMTSVANGYVSSSLVKEIASFGGDVSTMIPAAAGEALQAALGGR